MNRNRGRTDTGYHFLDEPLGTGLSSTINEGKHLVMRLGNQERVVRIDPTTSCPTICSLRILLVLPRCKSYAQSPAKGKARGANPRGSTILRHRRSYCTAVARSNWFLAFPVARYVPLLEQAVFLLCRLPDAVFDFGDVAQQ